MRLYQKLLLKEIMEFLNADISEDLEEVAFKAEKYQILLHES
jgi:hypothetical protein